MVNIREFYEADGELRPGKKGELALAVSLNFVLKICVIIISGYYNNYNDIVKLLEQLIYFILGEK